jgi:hypothetical protein
MPTLESREVAFLIESSTVYGQEVGRSVDKGDPSAKPQPGDRPGETPDEHCAPVSAGPFSNPQVFRFPMHISRLRSAAQQQRLRTAAATPSSIPRALPLSMDDPGTGNDAIPSFTPEMTSAGVEIALTRILEAVRRDHVRVVGLFATDTRDRLFLADLLRRAAPDVVLVTIESDLLFGHPDFLGAMRGALVASSYPLFSDTQLWANPGERTRVQFRTTNAQGTYNAALVLLNMTLQGETTWPPAFVNRPRLADYAPLLGGCEKGGCLPSGWISIVGQDGLWPSLAASARGPTEYYALRVPSADNDATDDSARRAVLSVSGTVRLAYVLLLLAMAAHVIGYVLARVEARRPVRAVTSPEKGWLFFRNFGWESARELKYVLALLVSFAMVATAAMSYAGLALELDARLDSAPAAARGWMSAGRVLVLCGIALWLALISVTVGLAVRLVRAPHREDGSRATSVGTRLRSWARTSPCRAAATLVGASLWLGAAAFEIDEVARRLLFPVPRALLAYERAVHPANGISPLLSVALITAVGYGWALVNLRRVRMGRLSETDDGLVAAGELGGGKDQPWSAALPAAISSPTAALPPGWMALPLLATAATLAFVLQRPLFTFESPAFGWFFATVWIASGFLILLSLTQAAYLWRLVRDLLHGLAGHPAAESYRRLPDSVIGRSLFARGPEPSDAGAVVATVRMLHYRHLQLLRTEKATSATSSPLPEVGANTVKAIGDLICDANRALEPGTGDPGEVRLRTGERALGRLVSDLPAALHAFWDQGRNTEDRCQARWYAAAEEMLALPVAFFLRTLVSRVANTLLFVVAGILMMVAAQAAYPFRPRQALLGLAWAYFVVAIVVVVGIFVQMERSTVLSHLSSTIPGRVRWDSTFVARIVVYVIVPLLTLFAAQFPEVGRTFIDWLQPVTKALPS